MDGGWGCGGGGGTWPGTAGSDDEAVVAYGTDAAAGGCGCHSDFGGDDTAGGYGGFSGDAAETEGFGGYSGYGDGPGGGCGCYGSWDGGSSGCYGAWGSGSGGWCDKGGGKAMGKDRGWGKAMMDKGCGMCGGMYGKGWGKGCIPKGCGKPSCSMAMKGGWGCEKGFGDKGFYGEKGCDGKKGGGQKGKAAQKVGSGEPVFHGMIKSFNLEKKHGYIVCDQIWQMSGQDVYAFQDVLDRGKAGPGDTVCFFVHWSSRGQPQASSPLLRLSGAENAYTLKGIFKSSKDLDKGFGFIECNETKEFFGRDVYVNKEIASTVTPGQVVAFSAYLNRDGMPNVQAMEPCPDEWEAPPGDLSASSFAAVEAPKGKAGGKEGGKEGGKGIRGPWAGFDGWWGGQPDGGDSWGDSWPGPGGPGWGGGAEYWGGPPISPMGGGGMCSKGGKGWLGGGGGCSSRSSRPTPTGKACTGVIKSFNEANNYGFIECDEIRAEYGNDVFVHGRELTGQSVGELVYFEVGISNKGQPQALNVQTMDAVGAEPPPKRQKFVEGVYEGEAWEKATATSVATVG